MKDELGERMKDQYEHRYRFSLPRRTYTILRLDGKAFHTYTKGLQKPFDQELIEDIDNAIIAMLPQIQGAVFAYTQSDEISILLTDFATPQTDAWFDGNLQKMVSVSASIMTAEFNKKRISRSMRYSEPDVGMFSGGCGFNTTMAYFDSRAFTIPDRTEVMNYFIWRNQDCARNSVSMVAQSAFSHKELQGKSSVEMLQMLLQIHGIDWLIYPDKYKNGRLIVKETFLSQDPSYNGVSAERSHWVSRSAWKFTEDKPKLMMMIPKYE